MELFKRFERSPILVLNADDELTIPASIFEKSEKVAFERFVYDKFNALI
jgi:hypothetical protein